MAKKVKITKGGQTVYPATVMDAVVHPDLRVDASKLIEEVNVSKIYPTGGIDGTNKYTLETAIAKIPSSLRNVGLKCSFLDDGGELETWEYQGNDSLHVNNWKKVGGSALEEARNICLVNYSGNIKDTRLSVPLRERKNGLIISYKLNNKYILEQYYSESGITNDASWREDSSWKPLVFNEDMVEYIANLAGVRINLKAGNNLVNEDNVQLNKALRNTSTGLQLQDFSGYNSSQFIPVKPNTEYTISCGSGNIYILGEFSLDSIESNVKFKTINSDNNYTFTTSERTKYILISVTSATINLMINEGKSALPYEKYKLSLYTDTYGNIITITKDNIPNSIISKDKLNNEVIDQLDKAGELILNKSKNLFNEDTVQKDSALRGATNISSNFTNYNSPLKIR